MVIPNDMFIIFKTCPKCAQTKSWLLFLDTEEEDEEERRSPYHTIVTEEEDQEGGRSPYHTIVLDCAPITFVDSTGIAMLEQVSVHSSKHFLTTMCKLYISHEKKNYYACMFTSIMKAQ